jgi:hypothetical protein
MPLGAPEYADITEEPVCDEIMMLEREDCRCGDSWPQKEEGSLQCLKLAVGTLSRCRTRASRERSTMSEEK